MSDSKEGSTGIRSIGYDDQSRTLEIEFRNGAVYQYYDCPREVYDQLMRSASKTRFFNARIRDSLPFSRV